MSAEAVGYVFRLSPFQGIPFAVHLAIADSVNDQNDYELWMFTATLASKARTTRSTASRCLKQLCQEGFLTLLEERPGDSSRYRFEFPAVDVVFDPRARQPRRKKVCAEDTPAPAGRVDTAQGVCAQDTGGCVDSAQRVCAQDTHNPIEPKRGNPRRTQPSLQLPGVPEAPAAAAVPLAAQVRQVFNAWISATGRTGRTVLDANRTRLIEKALGRFPVDDVIDAVRGWEHSAWHRGHNENRNPVNHLNYLLRNAETIEKFRDLARGPREPDPGPNRSVIRDRSKPSGRVEL